MKTHTKIFALDFEGVQLNDSMFTEQISKAIDFYLSVDTNDYLWGFRHRRGIENPGKQLNGWYGSGVYHVFGQIIGGLAKVYACRPDRAIYQKVVDMLNGFIECVEEDGFCFNNKRDQGCDMHYEYEKLLSGLLDCYHYLKLDYVADTISKITDWAVTNLDRSMTKGTFDVREWYTLSENLYRAYLLLGDQKYLAFAKVWEYDYYWNKYLNLTTFDMQPRHAYSHVNSLSGAAMAYKVTGEQRYLTIIKNAFDYLTQGNIYATGGYGPSEKLFEAHGYMSNTVLHQLDDGWGNCEVSCCSYAAFKLCRYLLEFTGDAKYADWIEKVLYNLIGAEPVPEGNGNILYYQEYYINGSVKKVSDGRMNPNGTTFEWPCCTGTFIQAVAEYANIIAYRSRDTVYLSQYIPASISVALENQTIGLEIKTQYPENDQITISISTDNPVMCTLKLRVPKWAKEYSLLYNGSAAGTQKDDYGWMTVSRTFQNGDTLSLELERPLYFIPVDDVHPEIVALCRGPVVLVSNSSGIMQGDQKNPESWMEIGTNNKVETKEGHMCMYPFRKKEFKPYYSVPVGEPYFMYHRINCAEK